MKLQSNMVTMRMMNKKPREGKESSKNEEKKDEDGGKTFTPRSSRSSDSKMRDYMTAELERVRKEMMSSASLIKRPAS